MSDVKRTIKSCWEKAERDSNNILERSRIPDDDGEEIGRTSVKVEGTI